MFEGNSLTCMSLYKVTANLKTGIEQNITLDRNQLQDSLLRMYESTYGYDLDTLRTRLKPMRPMKIVP